MELINQNRRFRTKLIQKDKNNNLICYKCFTYKSIEEFDSTNLKSSWFRENKDRRCKCCKKKQYLKRRLNNRDKRDINRLLVERYCGLKDRSKKYNFIIDFNVDYLKELWNSQNGLCNISKIPMTYIMNQGRIYTNVSVDRIDSNIGYIKGNIQLVCMAVNQMKSDLSMNELVYICKEIINNYENNNN